MLNSGKRTCDIAIELGLNWSTVNNWKLRHGRTRKVSSDYDINDLFETKNDNENYSYILGMYLGCGNISELPKTCALRTYIHKKYPSAINYTENCYKEFFENKTKLVDRSETTNKNRVEILTFSKNLPLMFPQHGFGKKKDREIKLTQ